MATEIKTVTAELLTEEQESLVPDYMNPADIFVFPKPHDNSDDVQDPFLACLACPSCGAVGYVTKRQLTGVEVGICGGSCSAWWKLRQMEGGRVVLILLPLF